MTLGMTEAEFGTLMLLDFDPILRCEHSSHANGAPEAKWRVMRAHWQTDSCEWRGAILCDGCLNRLYDLSHDQVRCVLCHETSHARDWWRLLGRI
jgi:hypothetical protein